MTEDTDNCARLGNNGDTFRPFLAAVMLIAAGLSLMVWDEGHDNARATPFMLISQAR